MPDPNVGSFSKLNMWGMLRDLLNNRVGILTISGPPVSGTSGSFVGQAGPGSLIVDYLNGDLYIQDGTIDSPIWTQVSGSVSGLGGLGVVQNAKMTYDFAVDGGAVSTITPSNSPIIPANAIITGGFIDNTTIETSAASTATIALGLGSGAQIASLLAAAAVSGAPWSTTGVKAIIPVSAATAVKVAAATRLTLTIAVQALTAGRFDLNVTYQMGNA